MRTAKNIIEKNINDFCDLFDTGSADGGLHVIVGKIGLAAELRLITLHEMDVLIDRAFVMHAKTKQ